MITEERINEAYESLRSTSEGLIAAKLNLMQAKHRHNLEQAEAIRNGLPGKNERERSAHLDDITADTMTILYEAESEYEAAKSRMQIDAMEIERMQMIVELTK